jgi:glycerol uptake facilitator-like aquaporin
MSKFQHVQANQPPLSIPMSVLKVFLNIVVLAGFVCLCVVFHQLQPVYAMSAIIGFGLMFSIVVAVMRSMLKKVHPKQSAANPNSATSPPRQSELLKLGTSVEFTFIIVFLALQIAHVDSQSRAKLMLIFMTLYLILQSV